jgi:hypothetical protein
MLTIREACERLPTLYTVDLATVGPSFREGLSGTPR